MENNSCIIYNNFLPAAVSTEIYNHATAISGKFSHTMVTGNLETKIDKNWRKSNYVKPDDFSEVYKILKNEIEANFNSVCEKLQINIFERQRIEMHLTSHNHGEFYKPHIDNGALKLQNRVITFVYYFHSQPKMFTGGQLLFLNNKPKPLIVEPANNSIVFFDSSLLHAVHPVNCPTKLFEHGRFTLNGWIHRKSEEEITL